MKTVLTVFAHPDDEILCIGTLANHAKRGDRVVISWMTDGRMTSVLKGSPEEKAKVRRKQMEKVAKLVGAETRVLDFKDSKIYPSWEASIKVSELIKEIKPDILITWNQFFSTGGGHPDHRYTSVITLDAITYARFGFESKFPPHREFVSIYLSPGKPSLEFPLVYVNISEQEELLKEFVEIYSGMYGYWDAYDWKIQESRRNGRFVSCKLAESFNVVQKGGCTTKYLD